LIEVSESVPDTIPVFLELCEKLGGIWVVSLQRSLSRGISAESPRID